MRLDLVRYGEVLFGTLCDLGKSVVDHSVYGSKFPLAVNVVIFIICLALISLIFVLLQVAFGIYAA